MTDAAENAPVTVEDAMRALRRAYVGRPTDATLRAALDRMLRDSRSGGEGRGLVVVGASGAGKTRMIDHCLKRHKGIGTEKGQRDLLIRVTVPGPCTLAELGRVVAAAVGYPIGVARPDHVWHRVRSLLREEDVSAIYLDEIQNISDTINATEAQKLRNLLKTLLNDPVHPVALLMARQPSAAAFLHEDRQVARRVAFLSLQPLKDADAVDLAAALRGLAARIGVSVGPGVAESIAPRLAHAACAQFGTAVEIARSAIVHAWAKKDRRLGLGDFADVHAAATGNVGFANPFVTDDWRSIDPAAVLITTPEQLVAPESETPSERRQRIRKGALR